MDPVTPGASGPARDLLALLYKLSGSAVLAGQHNQPMHGSAWTARLGELTGKVPALWGGEFGFSAPGTLDAVDRRRPNLAEAVDWHRRGAVITYTWHAVCPVDDEPVTFEGSIQRGDFTDAQYEELLTPGSRLHGRWLSQLDTIADLLRQLETLGVPVLWRPYHEMNGRWFWWGGRPEHLVRLWRAMFERLVGQLGLTNLIWVWSPNVTGDGVADFAPYFPGHDVVDALALDVYGGRFRPDDYEALLRLADGRPIGLGEVGGLPSPATLDAQPRWAWFMAWPDMVTQENTVAEIRAVYHDRRVLDVPALHDRA